MLSEERKKMKLGLEIVSKSFFFLFLNQRNALEKQHRTGIWVQEAQDSGGSNHVGQKIALQLS